MGTCIFQLDLVPRNQSIKQNNLIRNIFKPIQVIGIYAFIQRGVWVSFNDKMGGKDTLTRRPLAINDAPKTEPTDISIFPMNHRQGDRQDCAYVGYILQL